MKYDPWLDAAQRYPEIHIDWRTRIDPFHGMWCPSERVIFIRKGLTKAEGRCALAHELAHIDAGDRSTRCGWFDRRQENRADVLAARRLVDLEDLVETYRWTNNTAEAADHLDVTLDVLVLRGRTLRAPEKFALVQVRVLAELVA